MLKICFSLFIFYMVQAREAPAMIKPNFLVESDNLSHGISTFSSTPR